MAAPGQNRSFSPELSDDFFLGRELEALISGGILDGAARLAPMSASNRVSSAVVNSAGYAPQARESFQVPASAATNLDRDCLCVRQGVGTLNGTGALYRAAPASRGFDLLSRPAASAVAPMDPSALFLVGPGSPDSITPAGAASRSAGRAPADSFADPAFAAFGAPAPAQSLVPTPEHAYNSAPQNSGFVFAPTAPSRMYGIGAPAAAGSTAETRRYETASAATGFGLAPGPGHAVFGAASPVGAYQRNDGSETLLAGNPRAESKSASQVPAVAAASSKGTLELAMGDFAKAPLLEAADGVPGAGNLNSDPQAGTAQDPSLLPGAKGLVQSFAYAMQTASGGQGDSAAKGSEAVALVTAARPVAHLGQPPAAELVQPENLSSISELILASSVPDPASGAAAAVQPERPAAPFQWTVAAPRHMVEEQQQPVAPQSPGSNSGGFPELQRGGDDGSTPGQPNSLDALVVPEPSSTAIVTVGLLLLAVGRMRRAR